MGIVHTRGFRPHIARESAWYWPIADSLARFDGAQRFPSVDELSALYRERGAALALPSLRFVEAAKVKRKRGAPIDLSELYEGRIIERCEVPTRRDDWHDLFNALSFITFPRAKHALHARQYALFKARVPANATRLPNARTREQDALSLFDEGGLCIAATRDVAGALRAAGPDDLDALLHDALRAGSGVAIPFGHALYEHLVAELPCPLATPYVVDIHAADAARPQLLAEVDAALARALADPQQFREPSSARGSSLATLPVRVPVRE